MQEEQIRNYMNIFMEFSKSMTVFKPDDTIRPGDLFVISCIFELSGCTPQNPGRAPVKMSDISNKTCLSKPAITQSIDRLTKMGFIERINSENDRRVINISFTESGINHFKRAMQKIVEKFGIIISEFGEEKAEIFFGYMNELKDIITNRRNI